MRRPSEVHRELLLVSKIDLLVLKVLLLLLRHRLVRRRREIEESLIGSPRDRFRNECLADLRKPKSLGFELSSRTPSSDRLEVLADRSRRKLVSSLLMDLRCEGHRRKTLIRFQEREDREREKARINAQEMHPFPFSDVVAVHPRVLRSRSRCSRTTVRFFDISSFVRLPFSSENEKSLTSGIDDHRVIETATSNSRDVRRVSRSEEREKADLTEELDLHRF